MCVCCARDMRQWQCQLKINGADGEGKRGGAAAHCYHFQLLRVRLWRCLGRWHFRWPNDKQELLWTPTAYACVCVLRLCAVIACLLLFLLFAVLLRCVCDKYVRRRADFRQHLPALRFSFSFSSFHFSIFRFLNFSDFFYCCCCRCYCGLMLIHLNLQR